MAGKKVIAKTTEKLENQFNDTPAEYKILVKRAKKTETLPQGEVFSGGIIGVLCGGLTYDMSRAVIEDGAELTVRAYMSGVNILVPKDVRVEMGSKGALFTALGALTAARRDL